MGLVFLLKVHVCIEDVCPLALEKGLVSIGDRSCVHWGVRVLCSY